MVCVDHRHACGLKLGGPPKSRDPRSSVRLHSVSKLAGPRLRKLQSSTSKLRFQAHPPLPGLPAGMKAVHLGGGLAVCCVCASLLGVIKPAASRFVCGDGPARGGRDGLGVAGSGIGRRGWHYRALASGLCSTALVSFSFAINVITSVLFPISPSSASQ